VPPKRRQYCFNVVLHIEEMLLKKKVEGFSEMSLHAGLHRAKNEVHIEILEQKYEKIVFVSHNWCFKTNWR